MGSFGIIFLAAVVGTRFFFIYKNEEPSKNVLMFLAGTASIFSCIFLIMASIVTAGVNQTCEQFRVSGKSCGAVFGAGFFANDMKTVYYKNINTVNAVVGASWVSLLFWLGYAAFEIRNYRNSSLKWW